MPSYCYVFVLLLAAPFCYVFSLHDALPISHQLGELLAAHRAEDLDPVGDPQAGRHLAQLPEVVLEILGEDRKSTRLNSSHVAVSYAVFCTQKNNVKINRAIADFFYFADPAR